MKTLDEVLRAMEICGDGTNNYKQCPYYQKEYGVCVPSTVGECSGKVADDAFNYLKEYCDYLDNLHEYRKTNG